MAVKNFNFRAGVVKDETELGGKPYWVDSDRIRFVRGKPQKIGGWSSYMSSTLNGVCRGAFPWKDSSSVLRAALGTHKRLYVEESQSLYDITPIRATTTPANPISTTNGSSLVTITDTAHGGTAGDGVNIAGATAVGGLTLSGDYEIAAVVDANNYLVDAGSNATSTAGPGGGAGVTIKYQINVGLQSAATGTGFGVSTFGSGTFGDARSGGTLILPPRVWSLDKFNAYLLANPRDENLYVWTLSTSTPAAVVAGAPTNNIGMFVTDELHCVLLGAGGNLLEVDWSDQGDYTVWTPSATNTAGSRVLSGGNRCLQGLKIRGSNLILTDASVWTMTFIGGLDVFGFNQHGGGAEGGISQRCAVAVDGVAYWMGRSDFFFFDGAVQPMIRSDDIKQYVFDNIDKTQLDKVFAQYMSKFNEIWFFYPISDEISRYVKYSMKDKCWDIGGLVRTSMIDAGQYDYPLMTDTSGNVWNHEYGHDDNGAAMNEFIKSAPFEISDGNYLLEVEHYIPDLKDLAGTVQATIKAREYPQATEETSASYDIDTSVTIVDPRLSGRQASFEIGSNTAGSHWRQGQLKLDLAPIGQH